MVGVTHTMGIIGFGSMARQHYQMLIAYDRVTIKGIYDPDQNACDHAKERNLEENLDEYLFDFELGNIFLAMIPKRVNYKRKNR